MFCAAQAAAKGARVLTLEHRANAGEKIRISGGGRCNFTNLRTKPENFICQNRHFVKSALARYQPQDFCALLDAHRVPYHEKAQGQLFCDRSAQDVIDVLRSEMARSGAELQLNTAIEAISSTPEGFAIQVDCDRGRQTIGSRMLVVATGGKSIPKIGATGLGYKIAEQFGLKIVETRPALVPLTFTDGTLAVMKSLAGVSVDGGVSCGKARFDDALLFTHRGLSGPAILQISSFWREGDAITVDLAPDAALFDQLRSARPEAGKRSVSAFLAQTLPRRLAEARCAELGVTGPLAACSDKVLRSIEESVRRWRLSPAGTEGYRTAEVTLGGVDTAQINSRTMEAKNTPGLYFVGEVLDATGWLGGYNFQWAWASAFAAGQDLADRLAAR
ncbi:MAG: NAD(P)/FAD-dependent oxidoreductase [Neomegalonema sp.]|nr:NAD(P)/FAD-dependent oxidoreductase [Neomegalonema sp.]